MTRRKKWLFTGVALFSSLLAGGTFYAYKFYRLYEQAHTQFVKDFQFDQKNTDPKLLRAWIDLAESCMADEPEKSVKSCTSLIDQGKNTSYIHTLRANAFMALKRYDEAIQDYTVAFQLDPKSANPDLARGQIEEEKGQRYKAIEYLSSAIKADPNYQPSYTDRGGDYLLTGQYDLAFQDFNKAIALNPNNPAPYFLRGTTHRLQGDYVNGEKDLDHGLSLISGDCKCKTSALGELAHVHFLQGNFGAAIKDNQQILKLEPADFYSVIWLHIDRMHQNQDDHREFERNVKNLSPDDWQKQIVAFFQNKTINEDFLKRAKEFDKEPQKMHFVEANFYVGETLFSSDKAKAASNFQTAYSLSLPDSFFKQAANTELSRMAAK